MFGDREGPETIPAHTIPVPEKTVCWGCKYYRHHMVRSGSRPEYIDQCEHTEAHEDERLRELGARRLQRSGFSTSEVITPSWCPYLREKAGG